MAEFTRNDLRAALANPHEWHHWARALASMENSYISAMKREGREAEGVEYVQFLETVLAIDLDIQDDTIKCIMVSYGRSLLLGEEQSGGDAGSAV